MKRLNNKGTTIVEIIMCFALASLIVVSLYNIIDTISTNKEIAETKFEITNQKSILTKTILNDIIQYGLHSIVINGSKKEIDKTVVDTPIDLYAANVGGKDYCKTFDATNWQCKSGTYDENAKKNANIFSSTATSAQVITFSFKNGKQKELRILKQVNDYNLKKQSGSEYIPYTATHGDKFYIEYGEPNSIIDGNLVGKNANQLKANTGERIDFDAFGYEKRGNDKLYLTGIGNIKIMLSNAFLVLDVRFNNVNLKQKYGLYLVTPRTIDKTYVDDLNEADDPDSEESLTIADVDEPDDAIDGHKVEDLTTLTWEDFDCSGTTYCVWRSYRLTEEEDHGSADEFENLNSANGIVVALSFPEKDDQDENGLSGNKYKTTKDYNPAIRIVKKDGSNITYNSKTYSYNWPKNTEISSSNIRHEIVLDKYKEVDTFDSQGNITNIEYVLESKASTASSIYFKGINEFQIWINKTLFNDYQTVWTADEFMISIYEHSIVESDNDDDDDEDWQDGDD